jgi:RNA polymerase sigma-70 factor (ECF subfamily)
MEPSDPADDHAVCRRVLNGDRDAYAAIVRRYQDRVFRLCYSLLNDSHEAEDAAQEIFVKAFESLARFRGGSAFFTWLYRVASNHCLDLLRRRARNRKESWEELVEKHGETVERLLARKPAADEAGSRELVERVLASLSPEHRLILTLREMEGLNYEELGIALHCSLDAVKGRLKRAREDFREKMRHFMKPENV